MTQEEKSLLLKDLCGRLPYSIFLKIGKYSDYTLQGIVLSNKEQPLMVECEECVFECCLDVVIPYLRQMSSMTEEERRKYKCLNDALDENYEVHIDNAYPAFDWLNAHHFDYRGLIPKGLALPAPEGMYNLKENEL